MTLGALRGVAARTCLARVTPPHPPCTVLKFKTKSKLDLDRDPDRLVCARARGPRPFGFVGF